MISKGSFAFFSSYYDSQQYLSLLQKQHVDISRPNAPDLTMIVEDFEGEASFMDVVNSTMCVIDDKEYQSVGNPFF